jgi:hypothetical protein
VEGLYLFMLRDVRRAQGGADSAKRS